MATGDEGAQGFHERLRQRMSEVPPAVSGDQPPGAKAEQRFEEARRMQMQAARQERALVDLIDTFRQVMKVAGNPGARAGECYVNPPDAEDLRNPQYRVPQPRFVSGFLLPATLGVDDLYFIEALSTWMPEGNPSLGPLNRASFDSVGGIHLAGRTASVDELLKFIPERLAEVLARNGVPWPPEISDVSPRLPRDWLPVRRDQGLQSHLHEFLRIAESTPIATNVLLNPGSRRGPDPASTYEGIGFDYSAWKKQVRRALGRSPIPGWIVGKRANAKFYHYLVLLKSGDLWLAGNDANWRKERPAPIRTLVPTQTHPYQFWPVSKRDWYIEKHGLVEDSIPRFLQALLAGEELG